jgi:HK97 family phage major capsid protein
MDFIQRYRFMLWIELLAQVGDNKPGSRLEVEDGLARSYIEAKLARESPGAQDELVHQVNTAMSGLTRALVDNVKAATDELAKARRPDLPDYNRMDPDNADTRSAGDFIRTVVRAIGEHEPEAKAACFKRLQAPWREGGYGSTRALNEGTGSAGGFTTPVIYEQEFFRVAAEQGVLAPAARQIALGARTVEWTALDQTIAGTAGQSTFFGGVKVYRKREADQRTASQPAFSKIQLNANDLTAYTEISRDLVMDTTQNIDGLVTDLIGNAIGWREDYETLVGTGQGEFQGILGAPCTLSVTRNTSSTIKYQDVFSMYKRLLPQSMKSPSLRWIIHPYTLDTLMTIQDASSRFIMMPYPTAGPEGTLQGSLLYRMLGIPVMVTEKVPTVGTTGDLILADPSAYLLGRRSGLEIGLSEHFKFDTDALAIRAKIRNDGQPWLKKYITLQDNSSTLSAFVVLN